MYESDWPTYVPVAEKLAKAKRKMKRLQKRGELIEPVELEGRTIAKEFWGKAWCQHIESFADYDNRISRGTRYVRNGSVCHLAIEVGLVDAWVAGSEVYKVEIGVAPLPEKKWKTLKASCANEVGSLVELLQGQLSENVMALVCDHKKGLFPDKRELRFSCSCPDYATMCKHIAAVMYGIGHRLDSHPELLFVLRDVSPEDLIQTNFAPSQTAPNTDFEGEDLESLFGIEFDQDFRLYEAPPESIEPAEPTEPTEPTEPKGPPPKLGRIIEVKSGIYDPDDKSLDFSGWHGRVERIFAEDGTWLVEFSWDSLSLQQLPSSYIRQSIRQGLDWSRMILFTDEVIPSKARDTKAQARESKASLESLYED